MIRSGLLIVFSFCLFSNYLGQAVPAPEENIPFLVTFGKEAKKSYGDDDNCQTFFFSIPESYNKPFYIRIFDPDTGGENDELVKNFDTKTLFSLYGGAGCVTEQDAREIDPMGQYKSGNLLYKKEFGDESEYDNSWVTLGPFNAQQGEHAEQYFGYVFKLICEGVSGDDGNLYRYFLSTSPNSNIAVPGGNAFTFEYTFRLHESHKQISHIYPFVDENVISVKQHNFDGDSDGELKLYSVRSMGYVLHLSGDNSNAEDVYQIKAREKGTSLDIQIIKGPQDSPNNNMVFYVTNQYGQAMPFYTIPIGGIPKYQGKLLIKPSK